jgi:hypothetical protein
VQLGITFGGLAERKPFPATEVSLDQVIFDADVESERLGGSRGGVICALQRRGDDGRDTALLREKLGSGLGLAPTDISQCRIAAAGIPSLR